MHPTKSSRRAADGLMRAYQDAVKFGIDMSQIEYLLTLTPAERLRRHDAAPLRLGWPARQVSDIMVSTSIS